MAEDLSPRDVRTRKFSGARRGYDRHEVTQFLSRVADRLEGIETELTTLQDGLYQLGVAKLPNLKEEIEHVGAEIQGVLDSAIAAAEAMRTRAAEDAAVTLGEADETSRELRGDAWSTGTKLLEQAGEEADVLLREAGEDALFIRAQAEQDAKRLVTDARRQADDILRSSREEGERIVVIARAESDAILEGARQSAEQAQERARALETRRSELLSELEAAESAMRDIEAGRAQRDAGDTTIKVIGGTSHERTHWPEDDGSVRVLPSEPPAPIEPEPVDAEEVAAEVERMRSALATDSDAASAAATPEAVAEQPSTSDTQPSIEPEELQGEEAAVEVPDEIATEPELEEIVTAAPEPSESVEVEVSEAAASGEAVASAEDKVTFVQDDPAIDDLFAKLRRSVAEVVQPEPAEEPAREAVQDENVVVPIATSAAVEPPPVGSHFDTRDRRLLPIENKALRGLKRRIVELQNSVLHGLRRSPGEWRLGRDQVVDIMGDELDAVLLDSFEAGYAAAAAAVGETEPQITGGPQQGAAEIFTSDLYDEVQSVLERGEAGSRRLSAEVGRVFRTWRSDEAERHVRRAARRAYNEGLLAGYSKLGVTAVEVVAPGRPCGRCSAGSALSWDPKEAPPDGTAIPPADPSCEALIVPVHRSGSDSGTGQ